MRSWHRNRNESLDKTLISMVRQDHNSLQGELTKNTLVLQPFQNPGSFTGGFQGGGIECLQHCFGSGKKVNDTRKSFTSRIKPVIVDIDQCRSEKHKNGLLYMSAR